MKRTHYKDDHDLTLAEHFRESAKRMHIGDAIQSTMAHARIHDDSTDLSSRIDSLDLIELLREIAKVCDEP